MGDDGAVRLTVVLLAVLSLALPPVAHADDRPPLYALVDAAAQRLGTADGVAAFKWLTGGSIEDAPRVRQVLDGVGDDARRRGLDEDYARTAFADQIHATEGVEYIRFGQWKFDPASAPTTAPDLAVSRAAIDGFNRTMVAEMAGQWPLLAGPGCRPALDEARAAVTRDRGLDPLYVDALGAATRSYCR